MCKLSKLFFITLLLFAIFSEYGIAGNKEPSNSNSEENESETNRHKKQFGIITGGGIPVHIFELSYFLEPNLQIHYTRFGYGNGFGGQTTIHSLGVNAFLENSFYVKFAGAYRSVRVEKDRDGWFLGGNDDLPDGFQKSRYNDLGAVLSLGNRWQWEYFTLGCEWVSTYYGLIKVSHELDDESDKVAADQEKQRQRRDQVDRNNFGVLLFHLGVAI